MSTETQNPPWRRIAHARPLVAWRDAQLAALARALEDTCAAWCVGWGLPADPAAVACRPVTDADHEGHWQLAGCAEAGAAWWDFPAGFEEALARALWGSEVMAGAIATKVLRACRADLEARCRAVLRVDAPATPAHDATCARGHWSGLLCASLAYGVRLLLEPAVVERVLQVRAPDLARRPCLPSGGPLTPVRNAVSRLRIPLRARLADCELDLASLQDLRVGDVVPLPHRLDAPVQVRDAQDAIVFSGYLARQGTRKALELAAPPAPGSHTIGKVQP